MFVFWLCSYKEQTSKEREITFLFFQTQNKKVGLEKHKTK
jgi:hypothetical protein